jgi:2-haloalkanoic acid dehalogenase type II
MIKAILFDCFGTLVSTGNTSVNATKEILKKIGFSFDPALFYKEWKELHKENILKLRKFKTEKDLYLDDLKILYKNHDINNANPKSDVKILLKSFYERFFFDDVIKTLEELKMKYKIYIASNSDQKPLLKAIKGKEYLFDGIFSSEKLKKYKPHIEFYKEILSIIDYRTDEVLFVGDSLHEDVIAPKSIGIYSVLLDRKHFYNDNEKNPDLIIHDLLKMKEILDKDFFKKCDG